MEPARVARFSIGSAAGSEAIADSGRSDSRLGGSDLEPWLFGPTAEAADELIGATEWEYLRQRFHLTPSQTRIARLLCAGYSQLAMAQAAQVSLNTVRMHLRGLFARVGAHGRVGVLVRVLSACRARAEGRSCMSACGT